MAGIDAVVMDLISSIKGKGTLDIDLNLMLEPRGPRLHSATPVYSHGEWFDVNGFESSTSFRAC